MKLALLVMIVVGVAIGASMPVPTPRAAPTEVAAAPDAGGSPRETVLERSSGGHFYAVAEVNGEPIRFLVDTGASTVAFSEEDARRAKLEFDPNSYQPVGRGAAGIVHGQEVRVGRLALDGKEAQDLRAVVMQDSEMSLLGQNYLRRLDVRISGDTMTLR